MLVLVIALVSENNQLMIAELTNSISGQKFAMLEMKSTISKVLRHYQLSVQENYEPIDVLELIIKSKNGVMLKIKDRGGEILLIK